MSKVENKDDRSAEEQQDPSTPSHQSLGEGDQNRWQQQQASSSSPFPGLIGNRQSPRHGRNLGGSSMGLSSQQQQAMMMMPPDVRNAYMQEMRRNEELMMAAQHGGGAPQGHGMNDFAAMSASRNTFPGHHQWQGSFMGNMPYGQQQQQGSPFGGGGGGGGDPSSAARMPPQEQQDPSMLLTLLQQEQERLVNLQRQHQGNPMMGDSWLPAAKRQRGLPPNAMMAATTEPWMASRMGGGGGGYPMTASLTTNPQRQAKPLKERKRHVKSFPMKLMETINEYADEHVLAWLPDGKSFVVVDPEAFVTNVLTPAFKGGKYTSFVRKLNRWGFSRLVSGTGMDCFHNSLFQRDRPDMCGLITSGEKDDTIGVDPDLLGHKPSLSGIEKYFAIREKDGKGKEKEKTGDNADEDKDAKPGESEEKGSPKKKSSSDDEEEKEDEKVAATKTVGL